MASTHELSLNASSPIKVPHCKRPTHRRPEANDVLKCRCGLPAEFIVDPPVPTMHRSVCRQVCLGKHLYHCKANFLHSLLISPEFTLYYQRNCDHDVWMKRSLTNTEKAIVICKLQASVNNLKSTALEQAVAIWELNEVNVRLRSDLTQSQRVSNVWMMTACVMTIMLAVSGWVYLAWRQLCPCHGFAWCK